MYRSGSHTLYGGLARRNSIPKCCLRMKWIKLVLVNHRSFRNQFCVFYCVWEMQREWADRGEMQRECVDICRNRAMKIVLGFLFVLVLDFEISSTDARPEGSFLVSAISVPESSPAGPPIPSIPSSMADFTSGTPSITDIRVIIYLPNISTFHSPRNRNRYHEESIWLILT